MAGGWREYHAKWEDRHWLDRAMEHWAFNEKFHRKLRRHLAPGDAVLDIGSGKGYSALYFAAHGHPATGIDSDAASVEEANEWAERLSLPARFEAVDLFAFRTRERFRISYSMGLIEHLAPEEAAKLLAAQSAVSELVVALAPTRHSERTLPPCAVPWIPQTPGTLRRTFESSGLEVVETFGAGDVFSTWDSRLKAVLPHAALHLLQNRFRYAMNVGVIGRRKGAAASRKREG